MEWPGNEAIAWVAIASFLGTNSEYQASPWGKEGEGPGDEVLGAAHNIPCTNFQARRLPPRSC